MTASQPATQSLVLVRDLADDWQVVQIDGDLFELQHMDPCRWQWHTAYTAETVKECELAFEAIAQGERPMDSGY